MTYCYEIKDLPNQAVLSIRANTSVQDLPSIPGKSFDAIMRYPGELGEQSVGYPFTTHYNMDMQNPDVEIGFPGSRPLTGKDAIQPGNFPSGKVATCLHVVPYHEIEPAYHALWIAEQGYEPSEIAYEVCLNDPETTTHQELQTQILSPLKTKVPQPGTRSVLFHPDVSGFPDLHFIRNPSVLNRSALYFGSRYWIWPAIV